MLSGPERACLGINCKNYAELERYLRSTSEKKVISELIT